jgi:hypothetical protein
MVQNSSGSRAAIMAAGFYIFITRISIEKTGSIKITSARGINNGFNTFGRNVILLT